MKTDRILFRGVWVTSDWPERVQSAQQVTSWSVGGQVVERVRYGDEVRDWGAQRGQPCHDCAAVKGEFHVPGCDVERCRVCGGQVISCECNDDDEDDEDDEDDDDDGDDVPASYLN